MESASRWPQFPRCCWEKVYGEVAARSQALEKASCFLTRRGSTCAGQGLWPACCRMCPCPCWQGSPGTIKALGCPEGVLGEAEGGVGLGGLFLAESDGGPTSCLHRAHPGLLCGRDPWSGRGARTQPAPASPGTLVGMPVLGAHAHVPNRKLRARLGFEQVSQVTVVHVLDWERDVG